MRTNLAAALRLVLVTDDRWVNGRNAVTLIQAAVQGGVTAVQLRLKHAVPRDLAALAREVIGAVPVPVLINDRLDLALAVGAAGVHLGVDDVPPALARTVAPVGFIVGATVGDKPEAARGAMADYWGIGPLHATSTKPDAGAGLGADGVSQLLALAEGRPTVIIGGVTVADVVPMRQLGASGLAVVSGILADSDPRAAASRYRQAEPPGRR